MDINAEEQVLIKEIEKLAKIAAETFCYYEDMKGQGDGNFYKGENETEGQCSDYALKFVLLWNEKHPENQAEIVVENQGRIPSGSYTVIKKLTDEEKANAEPSIKWTNREKSGYLINVKINNTESVVFFHPDPTIGIYQLVQKQSYKVIQHLGIDMVNNYQGPHVWARVGNIAVDPCWADTNNKAFTGKDICANPNENKTPHQK